MADFVQKSITKSAVRALTTPIADAAALNTIVNNLITNNPLGCTSYEVGGVTMAPVAKTRESYTARIVFVDNEVAIMEVYFRAACLLRDRVRSREGRGEGVTFPLYRITGTLGEEFCLLRMGEDPFFESGCRMTGEQGFLFNK